MGTMIESSFANFSDAIRNGITSCYTTRTLQQYSLVLVAKHTCQRSKTGTLGFHIDFGQAVAIEEGFFAYFGDACWDGHISQGITSGKSITANSGNAVRQAYLL